MYRIGNGRNDWHVNDDEALLGREQPSVRSVQMTADPQRISIDLKRTAVIVVDMQNDFCSQGGWVDSIGGDYAVLGELAETQNRMLRALRAEDVPIIWLNWGNRADRLNLSPSILHVYNGNGRGTGVGEPLPNGSKVLEKGSWGAAIIDALQIEEEDIHVDKYRMSGFWDTPLDSILRNLRIDTLLFMGVNLDQCVMATLEDAVHAGYDAVLIKDCCATNSPSYCTEATYYNVKQCYGFITESSHLLKALTQ
jgi:nicotinamidase-related amidase